jgi:serine/threonine protein kinase
MISDPLVGRRLANFQVERPLGQGGMAQVYYGQDIKLRRPVAIKVVDARYRDKPVYAERFVREAQTIATWRHENIIQIYYADDEGGLYYFVMEYIDGVDLEERLAHYEAKGETMPPAEVIRIGRAIANALDYAHKRGVIHRDVKPTNVLMAQDGRVVLADFGLAMDIELGSLGEVFGSAHYVAPEQARNSADAVPQSDLYSLGVILYRMLVGRVPFDDPSSTAVALQHLTLAPPPPRQLNPALRLETEAVLLTALSKSPVERYQTGRELMEALERTIQPEKMTLPGSSKPTRLPLPPDPAELTHLSPLPKARPVPARAARPWLYLGLGAGLALLIVIILGILLATFLWLRPGSAGNEAVIINQTLENLATATAQSAAGQATPDSPIHLETSTPPGVAQAATPTLAPTFTPVPSPTSTPVPQPQVLADTLADFSSGQGKWEYLWSPPGENKWSSMVYESRQYGACWYNQDYIRICPEAAHPGNGADVAWRWTSNVSGPLQIELSVAKKDTGGDGVLIYVQHYAANNIVFPLFSGSLEGRDKRGFRETLTVENIAPGDQVLLIIQRNGRAESDYTALEARICYYSCP